MDKIEKLSTNEKFDKVVENLEKIMELLEDQKQLEGESLCPYVATVGTPILESTTTYFNTEPEKQEGWRELSEDTRRILKTLGYYFSDGEEHYSCPICGIDVVKLDQLLSKRTFSKEELEQIHYLVGREGFEVEDTELDNFDNKKLLKKLSKLLKESKDEE